jgi:hypothetical protein
MEPITPNKLEEAPIKIDKGGYVLEQESFSGEKYGFKFFIVQFKRVADALAKYSEDVVLRLINSKLAASMRVDAGSQLPKYEKPEQQKVEWAKIKLTNPLLITEADAESYIPGERELSYDGYINSAKRAAKDGDKAEAMRLLKKAQELLEAELS